MFTQSCFIRKNSPYLQEKLKGMGYKTDSISVSTGCIATSSTHDSFVVINESRFDSINPHVTWNNGHRIDCGTNEELFLALAALRDDTDYMQWFICDDNESMFKVDKPDMSMSKFVREYMDGWDVSGARKATVEEIIKHFKMKDWGK